MISAEYETTERRTAFIAMDKLFDTSSLNAISDEVSETVEFEVFDFDDEKLHTFSLTVDQLMALYEAIPVLLYAAEVPTWEGEHGAVLASADEEMLP